MNETGIAIPARPLQNGKLMGCVRLRRARGRGGRRYGTGIKRSDLESYFLDPGGSSFIKDEYDRLVGRILIGAKENLDVVLGVVEPLESGENIFLRHLLLLKIDIHESVDADYGKVGFAGRLRARGRREINIDPLHIDHRQAHQHKCGEQEEHDVDQGDDLDPGPLNWYRRTAVAADPHLGQYWQWWLDFEVN